MSRSEPICLRFSMKISSFHLQPPIFLNPSKISPLTLMPLLYNSTVLYRLTAIYQYKFLFPFCLLPPELIFPASKQSFNVLGKSVSLSHSLSPSSCIVLDLKSKLCTISSLFYLFLLLPSLSKLEGWKAAGTQVFEATHTLRSTVSSS